MEATLLELADGRRLAWTETGDPAGAPLIILHGTPGCRLSGRHPDPGRVADAGLRLISCDRPGYGRSTRHPGRRVVDCVGDVAAIADAAGIDRFAVAGGSGGGPHALAVGARLPDRVTRVGCEVGGAPFDASDLDWFAGMDPSNVREFRWALDGEDTLAAALEDLALTILADLDRDPAALLGDFDLSDADRAVLADPAVLRTLRAALGEALVGGVSGWVDDDLAFISPWGFDVAELTVPVEVRYGASDVLVPAAHGAWLARNVPGARVIVDGDRGHMMGHDERLERFRVIATAGLESTP
jgi:pimeloyl-ACP methyl ester carboxylesterase